VYKYPDGSSYAGEYKNGLKHGKAVLTNAKGVKTDSEWKNGKQIL
jgi:hypothetical protein